MIDFPRLAGLVGSAALVLPFGAGDRLAPDGARGFGSPEVPEILAVLRSSRSEDEAFLDGLDELSPRIVASLAELRDAYRRQSYFVLTGDEDGDLERLHASFAARLDDPEGSLRGPEPQATVFAAMVVDVRFRVRHDLLADLWLDERDLRAGLAVLRADAHGGAELPDATVLALARRVDVAASRLRARLKDLEALRRAPTRSGDGGLTKRVDELVTAAREGASGAVEEALASAVRRREMMARQLFTTRLDRELELELRWRERALERVERLASEARALHPDVEAEGPAKGQARLSRTERIRRALSVALEGLEFDPLHEELTWIAAESNDVVGGGANARSLYERYLALRGIRSWDDSTYRDRDLNEREERALWVVQSTGSGIVPR